MQIISFSLLRLIWGQSAAHLLHLCNAKVNLQHCSDAVNVLLTGPKSSAAKISWLSAFCQVFLSFASVDLKCSVSNSELELNYWSAMIILCCCKAGAVTSSALVKLLIFTLQSFCYAKLLFRITPDLLRWYKANMLWSCWTKDSLLRRYFNN